MTGLGGDMLLAALLDVGAPPAQLRAAIPSTGLTAERITGHGLSATLVRAEVADTRTGRRPAELVAPASRATPEPVAALAVAAVTASATGYGTVAHRLADRPNVTGTLTEALAGGGEEQVPTARAAAERVRIAASAHRGG